MLHELPEVLENHSIKAEDTNVTDLKGALEVVEAEIGRVGDAIRLRGFDNSLAAVLDGLEAQRKAIRQQMSETSLRASKSFLENCIRNLIASIRAGEPVPEINQHMRLVFKSLVMDHANKVIRLTLEDGSETFIALD